MIKKFLFLILVIIFGLFPNTILDLLHVSVTELIYNVSIPEVIVDVSIPELIVDVDARPGQMAGEGVASSAADTIITYYKKIIFRI